MGHPVVENTPMPRETHVQHWRASQRPFGEKSKKWTYNALPSNATERKNMKSIRFEMVLVHEAFQYLLRRKAMQVSLKYNYEKYFRKYYLLF